MKPRLPAGLEVRPRTRHPVLHLSSGYRPPNNEPHALHSQTLRGRKECKFIPAQQEASVALPSLGPRAATHRDLPSRCCCSMSWGQGRDPGQARAGHSGLGPSRAHPPPSQRTQMTSMGTPLRGLPGVNPMGEGILREITELQCHLNSLCFSNMFPIPTSPKNSPQKARILLTSGKRECIKRL